MKYYIYGLYASDDKEQRIRYVGCTTNLVVRLSHHINCVEAPKLKAWITEVLARGETIKMSRIERLDDLEAARVMEQKYITFLKVSNDRIRTNPDCPTRFRTNHRRR